MQPVSSKALSGAPKSCVPIHHVRSEEEMRRLGGTLRLKRGDTVLLYGELGTGKTTLVRGYLQSLGFEGPVRSPTFNLLQEFDTEPPVLHVDLYRVDDARNLGIEDYLDSHVCFIEWAERAEGIAEGRTVRRIWIRFEGEGREVELAY